MFGLPSPFLETPINILVAAVSKPRMEHCKGPVQETIKETSKPPRLVAVLKPVLNVVDWIYWYMLLGATENVLARNLMFQVFNPLGRSSGVQTIYYHLLVQFHCSWMFFQINIEDRPRHLPKMCFFVLYVPFSGKQSGNGGTLKKALAASAKGSSL